MKICIIGGGTAGWLSALMISKAYPQHTVTVIESSKIGIIGAGEGSTSVLTSLLNNTVLDIGTNLEEFIIETGATLKYGITHKNWGKTKDHSYFGPLGGTPTARHARDWFFLNQMVLNPKKIHHTTLEGLYVDYDLSDYKDDNFSVSPEGELQFSFHFDAHKVGQYFKSKTEFVKSIDSVVKKVYLDEQGFISSVDLDNGQTINADFFIDASGFSKVLMNELDNKWESYSKYLPVNCAMPFLLPHEEKINPYTLAHAHNNGWMWQIPTMDRRGCGYVFCDDFTTPEQAQQEIETSLGHEIDPIRILKFDTGKLKYNWRKNCVAIGLSSAFAEPLEATSIHSTIMQLLYLIYNGLSGYGKKYIHNEGIVNNYNSYTTKIFENYRDFLNIHYMSGRSDTEFWKYMTSNNSKTDKVKDLIEICKHRIPNQKDFDTLDGGAGYDIWIFVIAGIGLVTQDLCKKELQNHKTFFNHHAMDEYKNEVIFDHKQNKSYQNFIQNMKERYHANTVCS